MRKYSMYEVQKLGLLKSIKTGEPMKSFSGVHRVIRAMGIEPNERGVYEIPENMIEDYNSIIDGYLFYRNRINLLDR